MSGRETLSHGTYVDDKRVVNQPLARSCVLRIGNTLFRITTRGEVCTIERTDAELAEAALAVARAQASQYGDTAGTDRKSQARHGQQLETMFRMDPGQLEQQIQLLKRDLKRGAPAWRPSSDLSRETSLRGAVLLSIIAAIALCGGALAMGRGKALVNP